MVLCLSHSCLIFPSDTWLPSRGLCWKWTDACEGSRLLTTWRSRSISSNGGRTQTRVPGLLLPSTCSGGGGSSGTMGQSQLQLPSVAPDGSHIFRDREVLRCIQSGFHTSHGGLLVQSQPYATTGLGRGDSALPQTHEVWKRRLGLGRGNMGVRRGI